MGRITSLLALLAMVLGSGLNWMMPQRVAAQTSGNFSIGFYGYNRNDIDRAKFRMDPHTPIDLGGDMTIEFWLRGTTAENPGGVCQPGSTGDGWINGHIIVDRDIDDNAGTPQNGDYGLSIDSSGQLCFGVARYNAGGRTLRGSANVLNGQWHHIAVVREQAGPIRLYVDGILDAQGNGPAGDISYLDGRATTRTTSDPFLVLGAEKHSYPGYLGYRGLLDELRISSAIRYTANFVRPTAPFTADSQTVGLYHFDEGSGTFINDTAPGGLSPGFLSVGGTPAGPYWSNDTPFASGQPTSTPTPLPPTSTPTPVPPTSTPTMTPTPVPPTSTPTNTAIPAGNFALRFDGNNDLVRGAAINNLTGAQTIEFWARPSAANQSVTILANASETSGWGVELNSGRVTWWAAQPGGAWVSAQHPTPLSTSSWSHVAITYDGTTARVFVNGSPGASTSIGTITQGTAFSLGGLSGYGFFNGTLDSVRISSGVRYTAAFSPPGSEFSSDATTRVLYRMNQGSGQIITDDSGNAWTLTLGNSSGTDSADPTWVVSDIPGVIATATPTFTSTAVPATATPTRTPTTVPVTATPTRTPTTVPVTATPTRTSTAVPATATPTRTPTSVPATATPTRTPTAVPATPTRTPTAVPVSGNFALRFDGGNDRAFGPFFPELNGNTLTIELWVRPSTSNQNGIILSTGSSGGWSIEINNGRIAFWGYNAGSWRSVQHPTTLASGVWHHIAVTYSGGAAQIFVNGNAGTQSTVGSITGGTLLQVGGESGYGFFNGHLDELRISNSIRYTAGFTPPTRAFTPDSATLGLYSFDEGSGQTVASRAGIAGSLTRGRTTASESSDPTWVTSVAPTAR